MIESKRHFDYPKGSICNFESYSEASTAADPCCIHIIDQTVLIEKFILPYFPFHVNLCLKNMDKNCINISLTRCIRSKFDLLLSFVA